MSPFAKAAWIAAGIAVAVYAVSYAITNFMIKLALDRELPRSILNQQKAKEQLMGAADLEDFVREVSSAAEKLKRSGCETVNIIGHDGTKLVGHWYPSENASRVIVAMHGWRSSWAQDFGTISDFWYSNNCSVLYAEQRGQGESGGNYMGFGMLERYDCLAWTNWVNARCNDELPIYLAGVSMGAATVLMASGLPLPPNVCGIIADCGFTSAHAIWKHVAKDNLHISYRIRSKAADDLCYKKIKMRSEAYSTTKALETNTVPVLFIHGAADHFVPIEMTYENYLACTAPKTLLVIPGADHGMSYYTDRERYQRAVKEFWNQYDKSKEVKIP